MRFVLRPTSRPSPSSRAPPDEPGAIGAVCSSEPAIFRPPGPRNARATAETVPHVTRVPPPDVAAAPKTTAPVSTAPPSAQSSAFALPVSTEITARSPSQSTPASWPRVERPSAKVTVTSSPRTLWALVRTFPSAMTTPEPRWREPMPTIDWPALSATAVMAAWSSWMAVMGWVTPPDWVAGSPRGDRLATCKLLLDGLVVQAAGFQTANRSGAPDGRPTGGRNRDGSNEAELP